MDGEPNEQVPDPIKEILESGTGAKASVSSTENMIYIGAGIVALVALISFFVFVFPPQPSNVVQDVPRITLNYSLELENGTVISSGQESFLEGSVGKALGLSGAVDLAIKSATGDLEVILTPKEAFGEYDKDKVLEINRTEKLERLGEVERNIDLSLAEFESEFGSTPEFGKSYFSEGVPWEYSVISIDGDKVTISQDAKVGQIIPVSDLFFILISEVYEDKLVTLLTAENQTIDSENGELEIRTESEFIIMKLTPEIGQEIVLGINPNPGKVISINFEKIVLDYNSEYVGKTVVFKAKLVEN